MMLYNMLLEMSMARLCLTCYFWTQGTLHKKHCTVMVYFSILIATEWSRETAMDRSNVTTTEGSKVTAVDRSNVTTMEGSRVTAVGETEETMVVGSILKEVVGYKIAVENGEDFIHGDRNLASRRIFQVIVEIALLQ